MSCVFVLMAMVPGVLAWRPFLDPLDVHNQWLWLLPPLAFAIALVYKTLKLPNLNHLLFHTFRLTTVILAIAVLASAALWILVELV